MPRMSDPEALSCRAEVYRGRRKSRCESAEEEVGRLVCSSLIKNSRDNRPLVARAYYPRLKLSEAFMDTLTVGKRLVELCRQNKNVDAVNELYDKNVVSLEAMEHPPLPARTEGIDAVRKKNQWWLDNHEIHSIDVKGPFP